MAEQNDARDIDEIIKNLPAPMFPWGSRESEDDTETVELLQAFTEDYVDFTIALGAYLGTRLAHHGVDPRKSPTNLIVAAASMTPDLIDRQRELKGQLLKQAPKSEGRQ